MNKNRLDSRILLKALFPFGILVCLVLFYWPMLMKLLMRWDSGDNNYCYLVIPLFIYLLWDRRKKPSVNGGQRLEVGGRKDRRLENEQVEGFRFGEFSWNSLGFVPIILSIFLIFIGELGSIETLLYIGIWGCVVGLTMVLYGWRIRYLTFPLIILLFIVPIPPFVNRMLTFQLKLAASTVATAMLRLSGVSVFQDGNIIDILINAQPVLQKHGVA